MKFLFKRKKVKETIEKSDKEVIITNNFDDRIEIRKYKLSHSITQFKNK